MALIMDLRVEDAAWQSLPELEQCCQGALDAVWDGSGRGQAQVDVLLAGDKMLHELNNQWRGKDRPTDVLSFPADENPAQFLGDIAIAHGVAQRDADASDKALGDHLAHLLIHGLLHLLGHDHINDADAEIMETLERTALAKLGIADPYSRIAQN